MVARRVGTCCDDLISSPRVGARGEFTLRAKHLSPWFSWIQGALSSRLRVVQEIEQTAQA